MQMADVVAARSRRYAADPASGILHSMDMAESLQPLDNPHLADRVYDALSKAILAGELAPGQTLSDRGLAERLGVSRTPVKEALVRLNTIGLVEHSGRWRVSPFDADNIRELFQLRHLLEPAGLNQLKQLDDDDEPIDTLATFFDDFTNPVPLERYEEYFARDHAFHKLIVESSNNRRLVYFYTIIEKQIDRGRHFLSTKQSGRVEATLDEHLAICAALGARDFAQAEEALHHHLDMGETLMLKLIEERSHEGQ